MARDDKDPHDKVFEFLYGVRVYKRTSPSQQKTHQLCPRKWWYQKIADLPQKPEGKGPKLGKECHGRMEHYLETGEDVRGALERSGHYMLEPFLQWAPFQYLVRNDTTQPDNTIRVSSEARARAKEAAPLKVEESIGDLRTPGGVAIIGYADLMLPPGLISFPVLGQPPMANQAQVLDHKFKKNLAKYADTEADLQKDPQAINYGKAVVQRWPSTEWIRFAHHNHQTEGKKDAFPTAVIFSRAEVEGKFSVLADYVDGPMTEDCAKNKDLNVKANTDACGAFGGCDFAETCPSSPRNRFLGQIPGVTRPGINLEGKTQMGLIDTMKNALAAQGSTNGAAPAQTNVAAPPGPVMTATTPNTPVVQASQPAPAQTMSVGTGIPQGGHTAQAEFIPAGMAQVGQIYFAGGQIAKAMGLMGTSAVFTNSQGVMFQIQQMDPVRSGMNDPVALQAFGLLPAQPAAAPAPSPAPVLQNTNPTARMPIVENGVQVSGVPLPGVPQSGPAALPQGAGTMINPPDANKPAPNPEVKDQMAAALQAQQAAVLGGQPVAQPQTPATPAASGTPPATTGTGEEKPKAKRGRPRKDAQNVANGTAQAEQLGGLILVVNGAVNGEHTDLSDYVADIAAAVASAVGAPDPRMADPKGPLGYGAWRGAMAAAALKSVPSGVCVIHRGDLADPVIEALSSQATLVIRGSI